MHGVVQECHDAFDARSSRFLLDNILTKLNNEMKHWANMQYYCSTT